jgi:hypothetical protein
MLTLFFTIARVALEILLKSFPRMMGDLHIAHSPKWVLSSAGLNFPLPTCYLVVSLLIYRPLKEGLTHHHIQIIEAPRTRVLTDTRCSTGNPHHTGPIIPVIFTHPPRMSHIGPPGPHIVPPPLTQTIKDIPPALLQRTPHHCHPRPRIPYRRPTRLHWTAIARRIAIIILPVIDAPTRQRLRILDLIPFRPGVSRTCQRARAAIEPELQTHAVDLVDDGLYAVGPFGGVGN